MQARSPASIKSLAFVVDTPRDDYLSGMQNVKSLSWPDLHPLQCWLPKDVEAEIRRRLGEHSEDQALIDRVVVRFASADMMICTEEMERENTQGLIRAVQRLDIILSWAERYPWYLRQIRREPPFT
jgi:hypothetical protein